jgi:pimeloyl-ACP methyl ester carboxylesterase
MKHNFVLVHGAWHGGWCWRRVAQALQLDHHKVFTPTLTGVGERAHLLSPAINLDTHINDVINLIEAEELHEVILAVHSYAGMIGTAVADRMPSASSTWCMWMRWCPSRARAGAARRPAPRSSSAWRRRRPRPASAFRRPTRRCTACMRRDHEWVKRRQTPHPGNTYQAPLQFDVKRVAAVPRTFVSCTQPALATINAQPAARERRRPSGTAPGCRIRAWSRSRPGTTR